MKSACIREEERDKVLLVYFRNNTEAFLAALAFYVMGYPDNKR